MCPEYYCGQLPQRYGPPIEICKVDESPLTQDTIERTCRNNCNTCYRYRQKYHTTRMPQQSQDNGQSGSSSGIGMVIFIAAVIAAVTKFLGMW